MLMVHLYRLIFPWLLLQLVHLPALHQSLPLLLPLQSLLLLLQLAPFLLLYMQISQPLRVGMQQMLYPSLTTTLRR